MHPGSQRQNNSMKDTFWFPGTTTMMNTYVSKCISCKKAESATDHKYGKLPVIKHDPNIRPFDIVHIDLIGPYEQNNVKYYVNTMIDAGRHWLELVIQKDKKSFTTAQAFDTIWLCRY